MSRIAPRFRVFHRRCGLLMGGALLAGVSFSAGCITGNEAAEAEAPPSPRAQLEQLENEHDIGVVSDFEYERIKARLEAEIRNQ